MIRMIQSTSSGHAKAYFSDALVKADYYLEDQELNGEFRGKLAERLGLSGPATKETFFALCENINPVTKEPLTLRTNDERTTGYDINLHCPKSLSIVHFLSKDDHILNAFRESVHETMSDIEADMKTRVRKGGMQEDRETGELLYVDFIHQTARPVDGSLPDPHLHAHCYVFNSTWDKAEGSYKAGQFRNIKMDMPWYQAAFQKRLSDKLIDLGYQVRRTKKSFEVEGIPQRAIDLFSKRTDEIGRTAKAKGITDAKALDQLGARTRSKKQKGHSMDELRTEWRRQLRELGSPWQEGVQAVRYGPVKEEKLPSPQKCLDHALSHSFERASVMPARRLLAVAYTQSIGARETSIAEINSRFEQDASILKVEDAGRQVCTTKDVLREEQRMVAMAKAGQGKLTPLYQRAPDIKQEGQQGEAVKHLLTCADRVSIIRGVAGAGKTTLMHEAINWMEKAGKEVTVVAPTSTAARDMLRVQGFEKAETVAALLQNRQMQENLKGQVLWVDEAGMLGTKDMSDLLELAAKNNARLILGGDTRQHSSVVRGDALRILNQVGKIKTSEVSRIYRQKDEHYKSAVMDLSAGKISAGFEKLDGMGAIVKIDPERPNQELVRDYIKAVRNGREALVISPTNAHRRQVTDDIRAALRQNGLLGKKDTTVERLESLHLTQAQKQDWQNYKPGQVVQFVQNTTGIKRGSRWMVKDASEKEILLTDETGKAVSLPQGRAHCFDVLEKGEMKLAKGDKLRITRDGFDTDKKRLNNGQMLQVISVRKNGEISLQNPVSKNVYHIDKAFGHIDHAHCVTSYASQGKTVDEVFIAQPAATFPATNDKQFYVSVSRAREGIKIYTDDKEELLKQAQKIGDRTSAIEMAGSLKRHSDHMDRLQKDRYADPDRDRDLDRDVNGPEKTMEIDRDDYEPGF